MLQAAVVVAYSLFIVEFLYSLHLRRDVGRQRPAQNREA